MAEHQDSKQTELYTGNNQDNSGRVQFLFSPLDSESADDTINVPQKDERDKIKYSSKEGSSGSPRSPLNDDYFMNSTTDRPHKRFKRGEDSPISPSSNWTYGRPDNDDSLGDTGSKSEEDSNMQVGESGSVTSSKSKTSVDIPKLDKEICEDQVTTPCKNTDIACSQAILESNTQRNVLENKTYPEAKLVDIEFVHAVYDGNLELVKKLLEEGKADVNGHNTEGLNALMISAMKGHARIVEELIKFNADVNASTKGHDFGHVYRCDTSAALFLAAERNHAEIVRILIKNGARVNCKEGIFGPLHIAVKFGKTTAVTELIAAGADVNRKGKPVLIFYFNMTK